MRGRLTLSLYEEPSEQTAGQALPQVRVHRSEACVVCIRRKCPEHRKSLMETEALKETRGGDGIVNRQHTAHVQT